MNAFLLHLRTKDQHFSLPLLSKLSIRKLKSPIPYSQGKSNFEGFFYKKNVWFSGQIKLPYEHDEHEHLQLCLPQKAGFKNTWMPSSAIVYISGEYEIQVAAPVIGLHGTTHKYWMTYNCVNPSTHPKRKNSMPVVNHLLSLGRYINF